MWNLHYICWVLQKTEFLKKYRSLHRKVEISHYSIFKFEVAALLYFLFLMYNDQLRRRLPEKRKPKVFYSCTECNPYLSGLSLSSSPPTADSPASDTFLEGKFKITLLDGGETHEALSCDCTRRRATVLPVFLCGRGRGPVPLLHLLPAADLKPRPGCSRRLTVQWGHGQLITCTSAEDDGRFYT